MSKVKKENAIKYKEILNENNWKYVEINFLKLRLTKAVLVYYDKLPQYSIKHTKNNLKKIEKYNKKINKKNPTIQQYVNEFNNFLRYLRGKEEIKGKVKEIEDKIKKAKTIENAKNKKKTNKINQQEKIDKMIEEIKKEYGKCHV
mgnify:CR=1 FL=1